MVSSKTNDLLKFDEILAEGEGEGEVEEVVQ